MPKITLEIECSEDELRKSIMFLHPNPEHTDAIISDYFNLPICISTSNIKDKDVRFIILMAS
jgi:hypothetical protein